MKKKVALLLALVFSFTLISCSTTEKEEETSKKETPQANTDSENKNDEEVKEEKKEDFSLSLYTVDVNTEKLQKTSTLNFKGDTTIEDSLKEIAKNTSSKNFDNLPIQFVKIETINGKKVATINLEESDQNKGKSAENVKGATWIYGFFQGSTGGTITSTTLIENFLQKEYKGQWIDGVKFTYNGKAIESQHAENLSAIVYR